MYSGNDLSASQSYSYNKMYDVHIPVSSSSQLSYWIYPAQANGKFVALDFIFTDGSTLRDSGARDQHGNPLHPAAQGGQLNVNAWNEVRTSFGSVPGMAGKTIDRILVAYDQAGSTGLYRGFIDDIAITEGTVSPVQRDSKIVSTVYATEDIVMSDYNVTSFGADSTGAADSTLAIQNTIDTAYNEGGGTVWMPAGTYKVTGTINVKAFVTLRGDYRDPDSGSGSYGTVIRAELASGDNGPSLFRVGGSAGVVGLTTYYPNQSAANPVPYNYTFEVPGRAWVGDENYMMATIMNVTMLNSYRGIGISTMANDQGAGATNGQVHESSTVKNVKGTVLYRGVVAYNGADVGTWSQIQLSNSYWANAGSAYQAPALSTLNSWTRANGVGFTLGDLEWDQFIGISCSNYQIGIHIVSGQRIQFAGQFMWASITSTDIAVKVDSIDNRWGMSFLRSELTGSVAAVQNNTGGYVKVTDSTLQGGTSGSVIVASPGTSPAAAPGGSPVKVTRAVLYDVSKAPYLAPSVSSVGSVMPAADATGVIQQALNDAGNAGGGVVYAPAGWYRLNGTLSVPANVELRGASSVPNRDQTGRSGGTVFMTYHGRNSASSDTAAAFVTLNGSGAGARGFRVFYPENNPQSGIVPYPFAIRGKGANLSVVNVGLVNAYNAVDFEESPNTDNHYIESVVGTIINHGIIVGPSSSGMVRGVLTNGNAVCRVGFPIAGWVNEADVFTKVINPYTRQQERLIVVVGASNETLLNNFAYGAYLGLHVVSGNVKSYNLGADNLSSSGYSVKVDSGNVQAMNVMRYNGSTLSGNATIYNEMVLN